MTKIHFYAILGVTIASLISLIGILFLAMNKEKLNKIVFILVSFAVGGLLGGAFFHLIPESYENLKNKNCASALIIFGIILFFLLEKFLHWRHSHIQHNKEKIKPLGPLSLIADVFHNFIDGILIASAFMVDIQLGWATTLAVILHEIPQEIGDFAILVHSGYSVKKSLIYNFLSACSAIFGAIITIAAENVFQNSGTYIIPLAAGGFIYLAGTDLLPELHKDKILKNSIVQLLAIFLGLLSLFLLTKI